VLLRLYNGINATSDLNISALEGSRASIFALRSVNPVIFFFGVKKISFSNLLETLDSDRGPWDLDLSAKMEALDPSRAKIG